MNVRKPNKYIIKENYVIGFTTNTNKEFYFDLEDFDKVKQCSWSENDKHYIITYTIHRKKPIPLHRYILGVHEQSIPIIDHKNNNRMDNRKTNLRFATQQTNQINRKANKNSSTQIKGVQFNKKTNKYIAVIMINNKNIWLGSFKDKEDAKKAREEAELKYFGEFAYKENNNE